MKFKNIITTIMLMSAVMLPFAPANAKGKPEIAKKKWVEGQIIVKPRAGVSQEKLARILNKFGGYSKAHLHQINVHIISVPPQAEEAILKAMSNHPNIEYCEKDMLVELSTVTPNDPKYSSQWYLPKILAPAAWDTSAGEGITVAILDTGVEASHPDLVNNLVPGWNVVSNNNDTSPIMWHGTSVAGVVAATSNNSTGVASVAWNANIMPIRVSNETNGVARYSSLVKGVLWAADHGADVANISYDMASGNFINDAAQYFRSKGGVTVVAAGNSNRDGGYSDNPYLITVSATDSSDNKASFSNYGNNIDVAAPGTGIYTTYTNGSYKGTAGTSFASPATAGVVALIMAANPDLTPEEVETVLEQSADNPITGTEWHKYFGHGRVNAAAAVQLAQGATDVDAQAPNVTIFSPENNAPVSGNVLVEVNATDDTGVIGVDLYADDQFVGRDLTAPYQFSWDSTQVADSSVTFTAYAQDSAGNEGISDSLSVDVTNLPDDGQDDIAPTINIFDPADGSTISGKVNIQVTSNDNVAVTRLVLYIDGTRVSSTHYSSMRYNWWLNDDLSSGSHTITASAQDAAGNTANTSVIVWKAQESNGEDTEAPIATIISPQNDAVVSGNVLVDVNAFDNTGVTGVDLYADGQFVGRDLTAPYQFNWDSTQVTNGSVTFTAYAQDSAGNEGSSDSLSVEVTNLPDDGHDNTPPTINIFDPADGSTISGKVNIQVTSNDNVAVTRLVLYIDGTRVSSTHYSSMRYNWWLNDDISSGSHTITASAQDAEGNISKTSVTVWK